MKAQLTSLVIGVAMVAFGAPASLADNKNPDEIVRAQLVEFQEVPALSTPASGQFKAVIDEDSGVITYTVSYENLVGLVQQAHIHFGQKGVNGGISVFLCSNLGNGPAGTPECPAAPASRGGGQNLPRLPHQPCAGFDFRDARAILHVQDRDTHRYLPDSFDAQRGADAQSKILRHQVCQCGSWLGG